MSSPRMMGGGTPKSDQQERMLRQAWSQHRESQGSARIAVVRTIRDFQHSQLLECELGVGSDEIGQLDPTGTGRMINAWAWSQAEIEVGQEVFVSRLQGLNNRHWVVLNVKGRALGQRARTRDPEGDIILYAGKPFRTPRIPRPVGGWRVIPRTQQVVAVHKITYTRISCVARFHRSFNISFVPGRLTYSLFGYISNDPPLGAAPLFRMDLVNRVGNNRLRAQMFFIDPAAAWLDKRRKVTFVLAAIRTGPGPLRAKGIGLIDRVLIKLDNHLDPEDVFDDDEWSIGE